MKIALICLSHSLHTKRLILKQLGQLDHSFVVFEEAGTSNQFDKLVQPHNVELMQLPTLDHDLLVQKVIETGAQQVISFSDRGVLPAARLRQHFGYGGNSVETEQWVVDKGAMRQRLVECGLSRIAFKSTRVEKLLDDAAAFQMPFIVKPASLTGSLCVELIRSPESLSAYVQRCLANKVFKDGNLLVEEYIPGKEFSVEGIIVRDEVKFLGVTESHTSGEPYFVGTGHDFFSQYQDQSKIQGFVAEVIRCLGFNNCPFHIEAKETPYGYEVIEVHSRYGGSMITELVEASTQFKPFSGYIEALLGATTEIVVQDDTPVYSQHFLLAGEGAIAELKLSVDLASLPGVLSCSIDYAEGGVVEAGILPVNRLGYVTFKSRSLSEANEFRRFVDRHATISLR